MPRIFKDLLASDELIRVFATGQIVHPVLLEMFALGGGYHGFWLDQEHAGLTTEQVRMAAITARAAGLGCFVRMPLTDYWNVSQNLEAGVDGVMAARVDTVDEAEKFVQWCKFAPRGYRGLNTSGADAHYTYRSATQLAEIANRDSFVAIQIESAAAVQASAAIAAIDGVDLLFVGPADLSQDLGVLGQMHHDKVWEAIAHVAEACKQHGKHWGIVSFDPAFANRAVDLGCRMLTLGNDVIALRLGIAALKANYADQFGPGGSRGK